VLGDDAQQPTDGDGAVNRVAARTRSAGPRHAAPRKSLLTKLHVPAGKAVALAAMPTAVLMGIGLTPHLAMADENPPGSSPFKPGPCVTQSDTPSPTDSAAGKDGSGTATPDPSASPSASDGSGATPTPSASTSAATGSSGATTGPTASAAPKSAATTSPTPSPSPTQSNPDLLGGLVNGVGDLLGGLLGGGSSNATPTPSPSTTSPAPTPSASPSAAPSPSAPSPSSSGSSATDAAGQAVKDLTGTTGTASPSPSPSASSSASSGSTDGAQAYPCPTSDADALAAANAKQPEDIPLLANSPWVLKSSLLFLHGLTYDGIVPVMTQDGTVKDVLKFTATSIDIGNLQQTVQAPDNTTTTVTARKGSTSTFTNGTVTMYTESISGNLLGAIPITFTPEFPPPLVIPELFFTNVTVIQAGQFGGDLHIPGMQIRADQPAS